MAKYENKLLNEREAKYGNVTANFLNAARFEETFRDQCEETHGHDKQVALDNEVTAFYGMMFVVFLKLARIAQDPNLFTDPHKDNFDDAVGYLQLAYAHLTRDKNASTDCMAGTINEAAPIRFPGDEIHPMGDPRDG